MHENQAIEANDQVPVACMKHQFLEQATQSQYLQFAITVPPGWVPLCSYCCVLPKLAKSGCVALQTLNPKYSRNTMSMALHNIP